MYPKMKMCGGQVFEVFVWVGWLRFFFWACGEGCGVGAGVWGGPGRPPPSITPTLNHMLPFLQHLHEELLL